MNDYQSLRKDHTNRSVSIILVMLILLEICSLAVLFSRLSLWIRQENENVFPLTEKTDMTNIRVGKIESDGTISFNEEIKKESSTFTTLSTTQNSFEIIQLDNETIVPQEEPSEKPSEKKPTNPGFEVTSDGKIWAGDTDVEIFKITYENGKGVVTVEGADGNKLIAPGTTNQYSFTLKNTGDVSLNYQMTMEAYITGTDLQIPVVVRVIDHDGNYCLGSSDKWEDILFLNNIDKKGKLAADRYANYTLEWQWPFEGNDELDTLLGNLATEDDIVLTIKISTYANECSDPDDPGDNPPQTGDNVVYNIMWAFVAIVVAVIIFTNSKKLIRRKEYYE